MMRSLEPSIGARHSEPAPGNPFKNETAPPGFPRTEHGHSPQMNAAAPILSLAIFARNEEGRIGATLDSLFKQSLLEPQMSGEGRIELWLLANGCNDGTAEEARARLDRFRRNPLLGTHWHASVCEWPTAGKIAAWNRFTHELSHPGSAVLGYMDADIEIGSPNTLWNLCRVLQDNPETGAAVDEARQDFRSRFPKPLLKRVLSGTARLSRVERPQICGQLYLLRGKTAREVRFPRDLPACEDVFLDSYLRGGFGNPTGKAALIVRAADAHHSYQAYTRVPDILRNQKRQIIGQTVIHVLKAELSRRAPTGTPLAKEIAQRDATDPDWLKKRIREHLSRSKKLRELFPRVLLFRIHRWQRLPFLEKLIYVPATVLGWLGTLLAAWSARRHLATGRIHYWPDAKSRGCRPLQNSGGRRFGLRKFQTEQRQGLYEERPKNCSEACAERVRLRE